MRFFCLYFGAHHKSPAHWIPGTLLPWVKAAGVESYTPTRKAAVKFVDTTSTPTKRLASVQTRVLANVQ
jgi:hypothetical protein